MYSRPENLDLDRQLLNDIRCAALKGGAKKLYIFDARSKTAARWNYWVHSGGWEDETWWDCELQFCDIGNIDYVAAWFNQMCAVAAPYTRQAYEATGYLQCLSLLLRTSVQIAARLEGGDNVLVHCTHGWDRTSQLCSLV